jgi:hypothetical protein
VDTPEEEKKEARKGRKNSPIGSAPARKQKANIQKQVFIHKEPFLTSQRSIENLPDFVNPSSAPPFDSFFLSNGDPKIYTPARPWGG